MRGMSLPLGVLTSVLTLLLLTILVLVTASVFAGPHASISIDGNDDLTPANGVVGGNGSVGNPYIIEGCDISGPGGYCLEINDTWKHLEQRYSITKIAMQRLYEAWKHGEMEEITLGLSKYFEGKKYAYVITVSGCPEDVVIGTYDEAEQFVKEHWWNGKEPHGDNEMQDEAGHTIGIWNTTLVEANG